ncbi:MAG: galactokinase, partial [Acutalibacteraceae bacterium]
MIRPKSDFVRFDCTGLVTEIKRNGDKMNVADIIKGIKAGKYSGEFKMLYKDANMPKQRYSELCSRFAEKYGQINADLFSAPGRTELGGNHTDHEHGRVLAAAVSDDIIACVSKTGGNGIIVKSAGYSEEIKDISRFDIRAEEFGKSASLIRGICAGFKARGYNIGGFCAYTLSDIPKGCGLSSSAAFEVLISTVINTYFNGGAADASEIAAISQFAENRYFGKPCGLLDQTACAEGGTVFIDFKNPEKPIVEKINFDFEKTGYTVFTVNTGGSHSGLT